MIEENKQIMGMDKDIHFTDEQGNEFFVKVRDGKVVVFKNKNEIEDIRSYDEELTEE